MVRFKTRWLLLAVDDKPLATSSLFPTTALDDPAHSSTSTSILSTARQSSRTSKIASTITPQQITRLLRASLAYNFGDVAAGAFGGVLTCKYYSSHTGTAIVRCSRDAARLVWASATMISSPVEVVVDGEASPPGRTPSLRIRVIHCGGTIKKVQNKAIELDRKTILRLRSKQKSLAAGPRADLPTEAVKLAVSAKTDSAPVAVALPIAPTDDDEDIGEALDPAAPSLENPGTITAASSRPDPSSKAKSKNSNIDPETQALLSQSRTQINSISM